MSDANSVPFANSMASLLTNDNESIHTVSSNLQYAAHQVQTTLLRHSTALTPTHTERAHGDTSTPTITSVSDITISAEPSVDYKRSQRTLGCKPRQLRGNRVRKPTQQGRASTSVKGTRLRDTVRPCVAQVLRQAGASRSTASAQDLMPVPNSWL